jgi:hypothetical protein
VPSMSPNQCSQRVSKPARCLATSHLGCQVQCRAGIHPRLRPALPACLRARSPMQSRLLRLHSNPARRQAAAILDAKCSAELGSVRVSGPSTLPTSAPSTAPTSTSSALPTCARSMKPTLQCANCSPSESPTAVPTGLPFCKQDDQAILPTQILSPFS